MSTCIDITGQRFGRLVAIKSLSRPRKPGYGTIWECQCDCGNVTSTSVITLNQGNVKSCGCLLREKNKLKIINLIGRRFGRLLVIDTSSKKASNGGCFWRCKCDCGRTKIISSKCLRSGHTNSCRCLAKEVASKDLSGQRFGRLVAIKKLDERYRYGTYLIWECQCDCGNKKNINSGSLLSGMTRSCGCLKDATGWVQGTNINPMDVPFDVTAVMKARRGIARLIRK